MRKYIDGGSITTKVVMKLRTELLHYEYLRHLHFSYTRILKSWIHALLKDVLQGYAATKICGLTSDVVLLILRHLRVHMIIEPLVPNLRK